MPNISPPPTHVQDVSDPIWKKWFSELQQTIESIQESLDGDTSNN